MYQIRNPSSTEKDNTNCSSPGTAAVRHRAHGIGHKRAAYRIKKRLVTDQKSLKDQSSHGDEQTIRIHWLFVTSKPFKGVLTPILLQLLITLQHGCSLDTNDIFDALISRGVLQ